MLPRHEIFCNRLRGSVFPVPGSSLFFADCSEFFERFIWADDKLFDFLTSGHLSAKVYFLI